MTHEIEINIRGIFSQKFIKKSFSLGLKKETTLHEVFQLIDKKLRMNLFTTFKKGEFPHGWIILLNGDKINPSGDSTILLRNEDQLSVLSALGGG
jgi:hypothetical protein